MFVLTVIICDILVLVAFFSGCAWVVRHFDAHMDRLEARLGTGIDHVDG